MIWSRYNILFKREGVYLFYNSLSNAFVELSKDAYDMLSGYKAGDEFFLDDEELTSNLKRMKAIVDDDNEGMLKIKYHNVSRRFDNSFINLTINPTLGCNFVCPYCFEGEHKNVYMTDEVEDGIVEFVKRKADAKRLEVTWFGGEPLLAFRRIVSLTHKLQSLGLAYSAGMITNGYLLNESVLSQLKSLDIKQMQITIDGLQEDHDKRRFLKGGHPTFEQIVENLDLLNKLAPDVHVNIRVNIDSSNMEKFIPVLDYFYRKHYTNIAVTPAFVEDLAGDNSCAFSSGEKLEFLVNLLRKHGMEFNNFYPSYRSSECSIRNPNVVVIGPEGEIYKCWNDVGKQERIVGDIWGKVSNKRLLLQYLAGADPYDDAQCRECVLLPVCSGGCPYRRLMQQAQKTDRKEVCPLMKLDIENHLWLHYLAKRDKK